MCAVLNGKKPTAIFAAIAADLVIGIAKSAVAYFSGNAAMLSTGLHSLIDTGNGVPNPRSAWEFVARTKLSV